MITLTTGQIEGWIAQIFWPFIRIGSCLMVAPAFAAVAVPARMRVVLAGAIALLVAPLVTIPAGIAPFSAAGTLITVQQVLIGVDPMRGAGTPVVGQLYGILVMLTFLALDGHLRVIEVLADGFRTLPLGPDGLGTAGLWRLVGWGTQVFQGALAIALPGITALLIVNLAFGMMSRAAPTLNLFAVGLPISLILGLVILLLGLPTLQSSFIGLLGQALQLIRSLSGAGA